MFVCRNTDALNTAERDTAGQERSLGDEIRMHGFFGEIYI